MNCPVSLTEHGIRLLAREKLSYSAYTENLTMLHLLRPTSLLLKVSCTCSAWETLSSKLGNGSRKFLCVVSASKRCVWLRLVWNSCHHQPGSSLCLQGVPGCAGGSALCESCSCTLVTLHPSLPLPHFRPPQINTHWQDSRFALQKGSQSH